MLVNERSCGVQIPTIGPKKVKKTLDFNTKKAVYLYMKKRVMTMKTKNKKLKKHTPVNDIGFGTKKTALDEMGVDNVNFDTLNEGFNNTTLVKDFNFEDDLYEGIDELEDF